MKNTRAFISGLSLLVAACGNGKAPVVPQKPPPPPPKVSKPVETGPARPPPTAGVAIGSFTEGTFGPRLVRNGKSAIVVSAPRAETGRRWMAVALDEKNAPIGASKHEIAEAPEDASAWDVKPVGDGFVLAWTRPSDTGEQLLTAALAADGSPRSAPALVTKSGDDLVAVRLTPLNDGAGAILTYGEKTVPKGGIAATGTLYAIGLDAVGRPGAPAPTRIAEKLSAWQVTSVGRDSALAAIVQRVDGKKDEKQLAAREELSRAAKVVSLAVTPKGVAASDAVVLANDDALPEIDVVATTPGRALVVWSDRRELDAHLFAAPLDVSSSKPKLLSPAKRAVPPRGDQAIVALVPTKTGAVVMWETVSPRSVLDPRRRFDVARLSDSGEALATPRSFWFPYENDEPELVRAGDDDVAVLTYGAPCFATGDAQPTCDAGNPRPWIVRLAGPTLGPKQQDLVDVSTLTAPATHAFDLSCTAAHCEVLAEGGGNPATVALASIPAQAPAESKPRWVYREFIEPTVTPPRLEGASAVGREPEFTGLHATRAGNGTLVGWITYAPDDADVETTVIVDNKGKKGGKPAQKIEKKKKPEGGARVAVRLLDASGDAVADVQTISEKALSKGDVAVAWGETSGVVAYVGRADGDEEVFVARIDSKGLKKGGSSRITNAPGAASDVALAALPDGGYVLGWVEARKGSAPAVYLVKLDKSGAKVGTEVKVGGGVAGDVSDLALAVIGTGSGGARIVAVWSDARDDATHGYADVIFTIVGSKELKTQVAEKAIAKTKTHSHYPVVTSRGDGGALIAWVEDDPSSSEFLEVIGRSDWGARFARIDAQGVIAQGVTEVAVDSSLPRGVVTGVAVDCASGPSSCRMVIARATQQGMSMLGTTLGAATIAPARVVWSWFGAPSQEVSPAIVGTTMFGCEDGLEKDDGRVRRLSVAW